jgi:predicted transcriptional regulator
MTASTGRSQISVRLPDQVVSTLDRLAEADKRSRANLVELLIADALKNLGERMSDHAEAR